MKRNTVFTEEQMQKFDSSLIDLAAQPKAKQYNKLNAIEYLSANIKTLLDKGWSYPEIAEHLTKLGLEISYKTLQKYHVDSLPKTNKRPRKVKEKTVNSNKDQSTSKTHETTNKLDSKSDNIDQTPPTFNPEFGDDSPVSFTRNRLNKNRMGFEVKEDNPNI